MKAPDKIYLAESDNVNGEISSNFASSMPFKIHDSIVYIRKDALLEWAKEQKTLMQLGGHVSIDDVIDKLNSM